MSLLKILREPFPYDPSFRNSLQTAGFFGFFIVVFLLLFKPYELDSFGSWRLTGIALIYGAITFICIIVCNKIFPLLFAEAYNETAWTTGKQIASILSTVLVVGFVNFIVSPLLVGTRLNGYYVFWFQGITLAIAVLPVSLFILLKQNRLLKKFSEEAKLLETKLEERKKSVQDEPAVAKTVAPTRITIPGDYQNENISLPLHEFYLVESASNYIKIYHMQNGKLVYTIIRSTMKKAEELLNPFLNLYKCHRSYIVNLDKVEQVKGNAQGYKVKIEHYEELIPVSRHLNKEFSDRLLAVQQQKT